MPIVGADLRELSLLVTPLGGRDRGELAACADRRHYAREPSGHAPAGPVRGRGPDRGRGLPAANAAVDWVPVAGEVVLAGTALYFAGDLIYGNREAIGHALSWTGHETVHVAGDVVGGLASGASHAWHSLFG